MVIVGVQGKFGIESEPGSWVTQAPRGPQEGAPRTGVKLFPSSERVNYVETFPKFYFLNKGD